MKDGIEKVLNARMSIKLEKTEAFLALAKTMVAKSNTEPGCLIYKLYQEVWNPASFIFYEKYENQQALDFHNASEHFNTFITQISGMIDEKNLEIY